MARETAQPDLNVLLDGFGRNDQASVKKVQELRASMDAKTFLIHFRNVVEQREPSNAVKFAAGLLGIQEILQMLLEIYCQSAEKAITLARKLSLSDPRLDAALLHCFRDREIWDWSDNALLIALDILDAISERDRLVLGVLTFLKHPNAKIRSKAALFISRRRPNLTWIEDLSVHSDARVRANIIEGLSGIEEDFVAPLFRRHVDDEDNRVAGNAVLGLYRLGAPESIQLISEMARNECSKFRVTSAWVMGQTGDPRFLAILTTQLSDPERLVRTQALRSLVILKKALVAAQTGTPLRLAILSHRSDAAEHSALTPALDESGQSVRSIPATRFFLKMGGRFVKNYSVQEYSCSTPLETSFVLCLPEQEDEAVDAGFEKGIERCTSLRRTKDKFEVTKLTHEKYFRCSAVKTGESAAASLKKTLDEISFGSPNETFILVIATSYTWIVDRLLEGGFGPSLQVIAVSPHCQKPELRQQVLEGGGCYRIAGADEMAQACFEMYSALLHHYRITWEEEDKGNLELEVRSESGAGSTLFQIGEETKDAAEELA